MLNKQNTKALVSAGNTQLQNMSVMNTLWTKFISISTSLWLVDCLSRCCWLHSCHLVWETQSAILRESKDVAPSRQVSNPAEPLATVSATFMD